MRIFTVKTSIMKTNTYVLIEGQRAAVIDPGADAEAIEELLKAEGAQLEAILLTHAHFDHIGAVSELVESKDDVCVFVHMLDEELIATRKNLGIYMGVKVRPFRPDVLLNGGETLICANIKVRVLHTPGHTEGGVCYIVDDKIFSGDTLFYRAYGRTDLFGGSFAAIKNSIINKIFRLEGEYSVFPGHGEPTSLAEERSLNPILYATEDDK